MTHKTHSLRTVVQEYVCTQCHRRWDFDEAPDENELCDAPDEPKPKAKPKRAVGRRTPKKK